MSTRDLSENTEANYAPSWDLDAESWRNQTQSPPRLSEHQSPVSTPASTSARQRNKPTLSCIACVNKKTKCDRHRPECHACRNRNTTCEYQAATTPTSRAQTRLNGRSQESRSHQSITSRISEPGFEDNLPQQPTLSSGSGLPFKDSLSSNSPSSSMALDIQSNVQVTTPAMCTPQANLAAPVTGQESMITSLGSPTLLSKLRSFEQRSPSSFDFFRTTSEHPFRNLWTDAGGLAEVIPVLPSKEEADWLVERYFQVVDPIYPVVCKDVFMIEYNNFWNTPADQKHLSDPAHLALQLAMFTTSAAYGGVPSGGDRDTSAVFYLSCCHQCLCMSGYLGSCSLSTLQTMVLVINYLVACHRGSDAWTFSGVAQRQAYLMKLHRDPSVVAPSEETWEQRTRCRLWLATMMQDTSLALYYELIPATMFYEIKHTCLDHFLDGQTIHLPANITDVSYLKAVWLYTEFLQNQLCVNKALRHNYSQSTTQKTHLISQYQTLYSNFDFPFNSTDPARFEASPERLSRQMINLSSNYYFVLTLLQMDENRSVGTYPDMHAALEASHEGMASFFALTRLFPGEVDMWGAPQTRAYSQATIIATILNKQSGSGLGKPRDPHLMLAKSNLDRYLDILLRSSASRQGDAIRQGRLADLQRLMNQEITSTAFMSN